MFVQNGLYLILGIMFSTNQALATSCQVHPSEYAYHDDSVTRAESGSANCRGYPAGNFPGGLHADDYVHCDGTKLQLADSDLGQEQYSSSDYYVWPLGRDEQLLFILPTRVSLTTITLHYYSDSDLGFPRLTFYAVSDAFDVWDAPSTGTPHVDVDAVQGRELTGRRNVSINVNFSTKKVLMYKYSSSYQFAVSEVDFFKCEVPTATTTQSVMVDILTSSTQAESDNTTTFTESLTTIKNFDSFTKPVTTTLSFITDNSMSTVQSNSITVIIAIAVSMIAILLILSATLIIIVIVPIWNYKKRSAKQKLNTDSSYSTLSRGTGQQIQTPSIQNDSAELYDQIQLSPSTGQTEFIQKCAESENINNPTYNHHTHSNTEHSASPNAAPPADSQLAPQSADENTSEQPTYAAVDKSKKKKLKKQRKKEDPKHNATENKGPPISPYTQKVSPRGADKEAYAAGKDDPTNNSQKPLDNMPTSVNQDQMREQEINPTHAAEELYTAVKKTPKGSVPKDDEETPPIPPHTVEELYTAVVKKPKSNSAEKNKEEAPPIPPQTDEEMHTTKEKPSPHIIEDLYSAVVKQPKESSTKDDKDSEAAPPLPPHTVEELYAAVQKKPKGTAMEDEEEAPPIPPHTVDDTY